MTAPPMGTQYSIPALAGIWQQAGGAKPATVFAVSIALAESGGDPWAVSLSNDYGLWQINSINFGSTPVNQDNWMMPFVNAEAAIQLSGNGANWAAWCTAWADPVDNCGHGFIAGPQHGSPAYSHVATVSAVLGQTPPQYVDNQGNYPSAPHYIGAPSGPITAWGEFQDFVGPWARAAYGNANNLRNFVKGIPT